jgi:hypothetical protein
VSGFGKYVRENGASERMEIFPSNSGDDDSRRTRRSFLGVMVAASAVGLAGCSGGSGTDTPIDGQMSTMAETATPTPTEEPTAEPTPTPEVAAPDVPTLNYALTLEHLENAFYRDGLEGFTDEELMNADVLSDYGSKVQQKVPGHHAMVGEHEAAHVTALSDTVEKLGGTPVEEANYHLGYETPSEFLGVAKVLEKHRRRRLQGRRGGTVSADAVFEAVISIHSVEARHASFLNELNVESPFPTGVDEPMTMAEVREVAG